MSEARADGGAATNSWVIESRTSLSIDGHYREVSKEDFKRAFRAAFEKWGMGSQGTEKWASYYERFDGTFWLDDTFDSTHGCIALESNVDTNTVKMKLCSAALSELATTAALAALNASRQTRRLEPIPDPWSSNIDHLSVSASWKARFHLIKRAGGVQLAWLNDLKRRERVVIGVNTLALLFGPFYYLALGMWRKSLSMSMLGAGLVFLIAAAFEWAGMRHSTTSLVCAFVIGVNLPLATRANIDYYKKRVLGDNGWW